MQYKTSADETASVVIRNFESPSVVDRLIYVRFPECPEVPRICLGLRPKFSLLILAHNRPIREFSFTFITVKGKTNIQQVVKVIRHKIVSLPQTDGSVVFARWRQCLHMRGHIGATWRIRLNLCFQTANRLVQLFSHR